MSFQDELNSLKQQPQNSIKVIEEMVERTKDSIIVNIKSKAQNCAAGNRLECHFVLNVPFLHLTNDSYKSETFFRNAEYLYNVSIDNSLAFSYINQLRKVMLPYGVNVSEYLLVSRYSIDRDSDHWYTWVSKDFSGYFGLHDNNHVNEIISPSFDLSSELKVSIKKVGFSDYIRVFQNGKRVEVPCIPQLLLKIDFIELPKSSSATTQKRIVCPICNNTIQPGTVCSCGWDPTKDYENYPTLAPVEGKRMTANALRRKYMDEPIDIRIQELEEQNKTPAGQVHLKMQSDEDPKADDAYKAVETGMPKKSLCSNLFQSGEEETSVFKEPGKQAVKVGDYMTFGRYPQGKKASEGKSSIEWKVLAVKGGQALLISKYGLDAQPYHTEDGDITWEKCTLRKWLNEDFLNAAFEPGERARIIETSCPADKNPEYGTDPGNATEDKVFLLSIQEAEKYFSSDEERKAAPTAYAKGQGAYTNKKYKTAAGEACWWWWLRSSGCDGSFAVFINDGGSVDYYGNLIIDALGCVRPALWIDL